MPGIATSFDNLFAIDSEFMRWLGRNAYGKSDRVRLYKKLAALVRYGKRLQASIEDLLARARRRSETDVEAVVLNDVLSGLNSGLSFSEALAPYAPSNEIMLLSAGEKSGELPDTMRLAAEMIESSAKMRGTALRAMVGPTMNILMVVVSLIVMSKYVVPKMATVMDPETWTGVARSLYLTSEVVQSPWVVAPALLLGGVLLLIAVSMSRWRGQVRAKFDKVPPWSFYRLVVGGGWMIALAALIRSGVTLTAAMEQMATLASPWLRERIDETLYYLRSGRNLGSALEETGLEFPDREIIDDLVSYADLPDFDDVLYSMGRDWVDSGLEKLERQSELLQGVMMLLTGGAIIWFVAGIIDIYGQMNAHFQGMVGG